jgi:hypothetical protein
MVMKLWVPQNADIFFSLSTENVQWQRFPVSRMLHYITLISLDPKIVRITVGCKNMCTVQLKFSHTKTQEKRVVIHKAIQKYIYLYRSILSTYAIYTIFKRRSNFYTINVHRQSKLSVCLSIVSVLFKSCVFIHKAFEIRWQITENFDPSIICAFLEAWKVSSWFMKTMLVSCVNTVYKAWQFNSRNGHGVSLRCWVSKLMNPSMFGHVPTCV